MSSNAIYIFCLQFSRVVLFLSLDYVSKQNAPLSMEVSWSRKHWHQYKNTSVCDKPFSNIWSYFQSLGVSMTSLFLIVIFRFCATLEVMETQLVRSVGTKAVACWRTEIAWMNINKRAFSAFNAEVWTGASADTSSASDNFTVQTPNLSKLKATKHLYADVCVCDMTEDWLGG